MPYSVLLAFLIFVSNYCEISIKLLLSVFKTLKKGHDYATTISWVRAKVPFAILRSALLCLRGTRRKRRAANISDIEITSESAQARIK